MGNRKSILFQVKYTNRVTSNGSVTCPVAEPAAGRVNFVCILISGPHPYKRGVRRRGFAFSGSNQARKGRLVDALAVRGDERRDTLR